jgi:uncharacterized protein
MRKVMLVGAIVVFGVVAAACTPSVTVQNPPATGEGQSTGISVSGVGTVSGEPDTLTMSFGVSVLRDSVSDAVAVAADRADAVIAALEANGVAEDDIQTTNYSIYPQYDWRNDTQVLQGYQVTNSVTAKIRDIPSAGETIDAVTSAGGDEVTVSGVMFSIEDNEALIAAAREAAWNDALAKGDQLAALSGVSLGTPTSIEESFTTSGPPISYEDYATAAGDGDARTPIAPGQQDVEVVLQVEFAIGS